MMPLLLILFSVFSFADSPSHWSSALKIVERHEFYEDNQPIVKPKDAWQVLFAVVYPDVSLTLQKDCVLYKVPGAEAGELKIKRLSAATSCDTAIDLPGDQEWKSIKTLQFSTKDQTILLSITMPEYKIESWKVSLINLNTSTEPSQGMSSAEYKSPKIILLAPGTLVQNAKPVFALKDGDLCHDVADDCSAKASRCLECPNGWHEIPNGCSQGPKYCGLVECGNKNAPACRRGIQWQREDKKFACREDSSFAYCSPGLKLQCEGALAYCR